MELSEDFLDFLKRCSHREKEAWDYFVQRYNGLIYKYIITTLRRYNYFAQNDEINDIFNKIFLAFLERDCQRLKNFRGGNERTFIAYLRQICFHNTVDFLREKRNFVDLEQVKSEVVDDDRSNKLDKKELKEIINILKEGLQDRQRYFFTLLYEEELDMSEIADIMNLKLNAVHQLKFRVINRIIAIAKKKGLYDDLEIFISDS